jgi:hypothetical protein
MLEVISSNIQVNKMAKSTLEVVDDWDYLFGPNTKKGKWLSFPWGSKHKDSNREIPWVLLCISLVQNVVMLDNV